jgi:hypothetical protein
MKLISHRGNINNKIIDEENKPEKILYCISKGYDVEIDIWLNNNKLFLGHDWPQYLIEEKFLLDNFSSLWCHAKNLNALKYMLSYNQINCFWHQEDDFTITSKRNIWTFPGKKLIENSIAVMPEKTEYNLEELSKSYGICSDNIEYYKNILGEK